MSRFLLGRFKVKNIREINNLRGFKEIHVVGGWNCEHF